MAKDRHSPMDELLPRNALQRLRRCASRRFEVVSDSWTRILHIYCKRNWLNLNVLDLWGKMLKSRKQKCKDHIPRVNTPQALNTWENTDDASSWLLLRNRLWTSGISKKRTLSWHIFVRYVWSILGWGLNQAWEHRKHDLENISLCQDRPLLFGNLEEDEIEAQLLARLR